MHFALGILFFLFAAALVFFSYKSFRGGISYLNFFKQELSKPESNYTPFCSIIAPCRGLDEDLEKNLAALFEQDFPAYEIIFVCDDENDAAVSIIKKLLDVRRLPLAKLVIAGKTETEAQKVHNLRESVLHVSGESKVFVFVDSDARPAANWLRDLSAPLADERIGAATGYRWFISKNFSLASEIRAAWNASIASALGANTQSNFCWGGSMALRRETFEKLAIRKKLKGTLSDDFTVTRIIKDAGLQIFFVPQALTASVENCSLRELFEFTTRQMKITRVYAKHLWGQSFLGSFLFNLVWIWGISILISGSPQTFVFWFTVACLSLIAVFSTAKSFLRLKAVRLVLHGYETQLAKQFWSQNILWFLAPAVFLYNCFCAFFSNEIIWRGIRYKLKSPHETLVSRKSETEF